MKISVLIPVYNAEKFLAKAIDSALSQPEVYEVVLIDDNSPDNSLEICNTYEKKYPHVRVVSHPNGENLGAAASRNLGIKTARCEFIAFLDADDYYLPDRFEEAKNLFSKFKDIDGVYEAIGMHFYSQEAKNKWLSKSGEELTTISKPDKHEKLFELLLSSNGYLHLDGLVVRKKIFEHSGYFPKHLRLHQDTAIFLQLAAVGVLMPGRLTSPVAKRGIHDENRILGDYNKLNTTYLLWKHLYYWSNEKNLIKSRNLILFNRYIVSLLRLLRANKTLIFNAKYLKELIKVFFIHPILTLHIGFSTVLKKIFRNLQNNEVMKL